MSKVILMGEAMAELLMLTPSSQPSAPSILQQSFAGDVLNMGVYLKRAFPQLQTYLLTAVGNDSLSKRMVEFFEAEGIASDHVCRSPGNVPGLYWIHTDAVGERTFSYWRENSAARDLMKLINAAYIEQLEQAEWLFFSGISIAVIRPEDRACLWDLLKRLKKSGVKIAFDPNYRERLWASKEDAVACFDKAFEVSDLLLPGVDDFQQLYGISTIDDVQSYLERFSIPEVVVKNGAAEVCVLIGDKLTRIAITPVTQVIDTTSAGDSFNGVYLGARMSGKDYSTAVNLAAKSAGLVIQHKGAIIPQSIFVDFFRQETAE